MADESPAEEVPPVSRVECAPTSDPLVRLFIGAALLLGLAAYCFYDGYMTDKYPYKPMSQDINAYFSWAFNHFAPWLFAPPGVVALWMGLAGMRRRLVADEQGIGYAGKAPIAWSAITRLDASKLQAKGLLYLHHDGGRLVLDSWKLRDFRRLVAFVETHVPKEKQTV